MAFQLPTDEQLDDYNRRQGRELVRTRYARDRQDAMDEKAAEESGETGDTYWKNVGQGIAYGGAAGVDEFVETGRTAMAESTPEEVGEGLGRMEERFTEAAVGLQKKADQPEERKRIEEARPEAGAMQQAPEGPSPEVTTLRDAFGLEPPSSGEGQMAAGRG